MKEASALYRLLGDEARLRLLRVLDKDRFNVKELTGILGLAQSGVSRHLGLLKESELVVEERDGAYSFYRLSPAVRDSGKSPLWPLLQSQFDAAAELRRSSRRMNRGCRKCCGCAARTSSTSDPIPATAGSWCRAGAGRRGRARLALLLPPLDVADLGCGEGYLTVETARWAKHVTAVDRSAGVLARAKALAERKKLSNITWKKGELEKLPIDTGTMDVALLSQALHHAAEPPKALDEASRILKPGGRLVILDLRPHDETWVREKLGDRWFGFSDEHLSGLLTRAGLHRRSRRARRAAHERSVCGAAGDRHEEDTARKKQASYDEMARLRQNDEHDDYSRHSQATAG